ncbi:unnamed protein product [Ilex paraguariensis]|uniref:Uncharacterized protein n=1 Tax=Ilex paraguariensis TaxID=185542 RepID=A0ABC8SRS5_9AQUA
MSYLQVISDSVVANITETLRHLQVLALCYCFGETSSLSFKCHMPNLRKLKLERVAPWMNNDDLVILTQNCTNLIELSLLECALLNTESQDIISSGWPGLVSIHLEDCGEVTINGVTSLFDCSALEDLLLRHNGDGISRNFILDAASKMPMLRKVLLDMCDSRDGDFDIPTFNIIFCLESIPVSLFSPFMSRLQIGWYILTIVELLQYADRYFLSVVTIARCKLQRFTLDLQKVEACRKPVHKETLLLVWDSKVLTKTVVKERV